jgi:adenylate cyclase
MTAVYPHKLLGRLHLPTATEQPASAPRAEDAIEESGGNDFPPEEYSWTPDQVRELAQLTVRIQTLAGGRVFRPLPIRKGSRAQVIVPADADYDRFLYSDPYALVPTVSERPSEAELLGLLDYLLVQLELSVESLSSRMGCPSEVAAEVEAIRSALAVRARSGRPLDPETLQQVLDLLSR